MAAIHRCASTARVERLLFTSCFFRYDVTGWPLCIGVAPPFCACISVKCYGRCNIGLMQVCNCACRPVHAFCLSVLFKCYGRCNIDLMQVCNCACTPVHAFCLSVIYLLLFINRTQWYSDT